MISETERADALLQMMALAGLGEEETRRRTAQAVDPHYWTRLNPSLSVTGDRIAAELQLDGLDDELRRGLVADFHREGWFRTPQLLTKGTVAAMCSAVEKLRLEGWPEGFAFAYDEFWLAVRIPFIRALLSSVLGEGYLQLPNVWGHFVKPLSGGWSPHVDGSGTRRLTLWIPLTDATIENSCMFVVPADKTPGAIAAEFPRLDSIARSDVSRLMQHARPLPGPAGCAMSWHHSVIHWGAPSYDPVNPRISISQEFIAADATPQRGETPLLDSGNSLPDFRQRLAIISRAILSYQRLEPVLARYAGIARAIANQVG